MTLPLAPAAVGSLTLQGIASGRLFLGGADVFNVQIAYGAKGDGVSDDSAAISAAVAAAVAAGGGIVYFPHGTYLCNTPQNSAPTDADSHPRSILYFTGLSRVWFAGDGATLRTTIGYASTLLEVRDSSDVDVLGLHFYGNQLVSSDTGSNIAGSGIRYTNVNRGEVSGCELEQFNYSAIYLTGGSARVKVVGNDLHDLGVVGVGTNNANAINEDALNGTDGGAVAGCFGNLIAGNTVTNCRGSGAIVTDNSGVSTHTKVLDNTIDNAGGYIAASYHGIRSLNSVDVLIQGNTVRNTAREGIYVSSTGASLAGSVRAIDNDVDSCGVSTGSDGILVDNAGNGEIRGWSIDQNTVRGCGGNGIAIAMSGPSQTRDGSICGNTIIGNDQTSRGTKDGISFGGHRCVIRNNMVTTPGGTNYHRYGINCTATAQGPVYADGNILLATVTSPHNDTNSVIVSRTDEVGSNVIFTLNNAVREKKAAPTYSASITPDATDGSWQTITVTNATAFTINAPSNPPGSGNSQELAIEVVNSSGGAMGAITWNAAFVLVGGAFTNPASTKKRFVRFEWNGSNWIETTRAGNDY